MLFVIKFFQMMLTSLSMSTVGLLATTVFSTSKLALKVVTDMSWSNKPWSFSLPRIFKTLGADSVAYLWITALRSSKIG